MGRGRRFAVNTAVGTLVVAGALIVAPGTASAATCTSDLCLYSSTNYRGTQTTAGYFDKNTHCYFDGHYNSVISRTGYRIRLYNGSNCNGPSTTIGPGKRIPNTSFVVHSFKRD
ncbi:peptidase inhibitor family I36 protein [Amycolatopsis sp. NPDC089917]|uniref:peptidase inhibitor family I36 protein n=1 Tax=Amycolatopsis sp. NPDC089917 TaxID=3155187 RepID=UPI00341AA9C3